MKRLGNPTTTSSSKDKYSRLIFWMAAFLLFFWALGYRGLWGSEDRWAEIIREMFLSGNFFHPTINGDPYFDKPLLTYWLIALVSWLTGSLNEWTMRVPSAVSGLLVLWATVSLGRRLWSEKVGIIAGWVLLTTYGILFWSRTACADMENLAAVIIAPAWYWARRERPGFLSFLVFYLICFLGAQTKGLAAVAVPVLAVLPDVIRERRWKKLLSFSHLLALAIGVIVYAAPFIYAEMTRGHYGESGMALAFRENILRYFKAFDHREHFYVYLYYLPELFLPWTPLLLIALWGTFASFKKLDKRTRWLAEAIVLIFLFFTCSGSRRSYYILPILPFCALLVSVYLTQEGKKRFGVNLQACLFGLISLVEISSFALWPIIKTHVGFVPPPGFKLLTLAIGVLAGFPLAFAHLKPGLPAKRPGTNQKMGACIIAAVILMGGFFCVQQVILDGYRGKRPFARELKTLIAGFSPEQVAFYDEADTTVLFYLNLPGRVQQLADIEAVRNFLDSGRGDKVLISEHRYLRELRPVFPGQKQKKPYLSEKVYPWEGKRKQKKKLLAWLIRNNER